MLKILLIPFFFLCSFCVAFAERPPRTVCSHVYKTEQLNANPEYDGGIDQMYHFIYKNLSWKCGEKSYEGVVIVHFIVDESGVIWDIKIEQSVAPCLDDEVVRALKLMPPWIPGSINGVGVCAECSLPVRIRLGFQEKNERSYR